jgi:elongation factor 1 alpha-like protein
MPADTLCTYATGHVDAGKSTLMGRLLHEIGELSDKELVNNQRQSQRIGKGSFAYAWAFDSTKEERERYALSVALPFFCVSLRPINCQGWPGLGV